MVQKHAVYAMAIGKIVAGIVLDRYIYIALPTLHNNQKHFQSKRPREYRAVLRERKQALVSPVNKVDRVVGGCWFQAQNQRLQRLVSEP